MSGTARQPQSVNQFSRQRQGLLYGLGCYVMWGLFPLYWYPLLSAPISASQILSQRIVWSSVFAVLLLLLLRQWPLLLSALRQPQTWRVFGASALLLGINWLMYMWAITHHHVIEASLGYFMSPLISIALGRVFLGERLLRIQMAAVVLLMVGVLWLAILAGHIPWVALVLSISFGFYGLLRKQAPLSALPGLALETLLMLPVAVGYLWWQSQQGQLVWQQLNAIQIGLLVGSGVVTTLPLLMFGAAAQRMSLAGIGVVQYVSPTLQFCLGLLVFHEAFSGSRFVGYVWVWMGVLLFVWGSWYRYRRVKL